MKPQANLNFNLVATDGRTAEPPGPFVWAQGDDPWELEYSKDVISSRPYIRTGILVVAWRPWGAIVLHPGWPVLFAADEQAEFYFKCAFAFGGASDYGVSQAREDLWKEAAKVMHRAIHLVAKQSPDLLAPRIAGILSRQTVPLGSAECRITESQPESTPSTHSTGAGGGRKRRVGRKS